MASAKTKLAEKAKPPSARELCGPGNYHSNAELCAQWKAADAADEAAWWARFSGGLSIVGLLGVSGALILTNQSNELARKSLKLARDNSQRELRAYVAWGGLSLGAILNDDQKLARWGLIPSWKNVGNTPARNLALQVWPHLDTVEMPTDFTFDRYEEPILTTLASGIEINGATVTLSPEEAVAVQAGQLFFYVWGWARYRDVFDETPEYETQFCYRVSFTGDMHSLVSETNAIGVHTIAHRLHNDAT